MSKDIKKAMNTIDIPKELSERSALGVAEAKKDMQKGKKRRPIKFGIGAAVALFVLSLSGFLLFKQDKMSNMATPSSPTSQEMVIQKDGSVEIPTLQLPENSATADMIGLIIYKGKIYTQANTAIDLKHAKKLVDEKIGVTKGIIDEWSNKELYKIELASQVEGQQVYTVKGYSENFRIMTYNPETDDAMFFEHLNGITIHSGKDLFSKLKMEGHFTHSKWRNHSDWDVETGNFTTLEHDKIVNRFLATLNETKPLILTENEDPYEDSLNDENFRELIITLEDGSKVSLILFKEGYIHYSHMNIYFSMEPERFAEIWDEMQ